MPSEEADFDATILAGIIDSLGWDVEAVQRLHGGSVNITHRVRTADTDVVLRFPRDPLRLNEYPVELWAARTVHNAGIPTAVGLCIGVHNGVPYMVSEYIDPVTEDLQHSWSWLGSYARKIGTVKLDDAPRSLYSRFGSDLAAAWQSHVEYNLKALTSHDELRRDGAYPSDAVSRLQELLQPLVSEPFTFGLAHGDLAPRNLISRGLTEPPVLIDWGTATTGPTPWIDASRVFEWAYCEESITTAEYDEFVAAAHVNNEADQRLIRALVALQVLDVTRWARDQRPDLYQEYVQNCRRSIAVVINEP